MSTETVDAAYALNKREIEKLHGLDIIVKKQADGSWKVAIGMWNT